MRGLNSSQFEMMKPSPLYQMFAAVNPDPETNFPKLLDQMQYMGKDYDWSAEIGGLKVPAQLIVGD